MDIEQALTGGNKRKLNNQGVIDFVLKNPKEVNTLFKCILNKDEYVRMRASDALEKVCRQNPKIVQPLKKDILEKMSTIDQPSVQWHYAQIVDKLQLTTPERERVISKLKDNFATYDDWITKNITMEVLGHFAIKDKALKSYLIPKLESLKNNPKISISTRATKILGQLTS